jgi:predicted RNA binding protein YcfA (HicA-like mRNA interferase family)
MRAREVIKQLKADGWYEHSQKGSHQHFLHPTKVGKTTVPVHGGKDIKPMTIRAIERQSGLKLRPG